MWGWQARPPGDLPPLWTSERTAPMTLKGTYAKRDSGLARSRAAAGPAPVSAHSGPAHREAGQERSPQIKSLCPLLRGPLLSSGPGGRKSSRPSIMAPSLPAGQTSLHQTADTTSTEDGLFVTQLSLPQHYRCLGVDNQRPCHVAPSTPSFRPCVTVTVTSYRGLHF